MVVISQTIPLDINARDCVPGTVQTQDCTYGPDIIVNECVYGLWEPTGNVCPSSGCVEDSTRCLSHVSQKCVNNVWTNDPAGNACANACTDNTVRCLNSTSQICTDGIWENDPDGTACPCAAGDTKCTGWTTKECTTSGTWADTDEFCVPIDISNIPIMFLAAGGLLVLGLLLAR